MQSRSLLFVFGILLGQLGCIKVSEFLTPGSKSAEDSSDVKNVADLWIHSVLRDPDGLALSVFSAPKEMDTLDLCKGDRPETCGPEDPSYQRLHKEASHHQDRSFFVARDFELVEGEVWSLVARQSQNPAAKPSARVISVQKEPPPDQRPEVDFRERLSRGEVVDHQRFEVDFRQKTLKGLYRIWAPKEAATQVRGLVVFLHGDKGSNYGTIPLSYLPASIRHEEEASLPRNGDYQELPTLDQVRKEAEPGVLWSNMIFVSALAPLVDSDSSEISWIKKDAESIQASEVYLSRLISKEIRKKYRVNTDHIYLAGEGSGARFLSEFYLPMFGNTMRGGAVMLCGAGLPAEGAHGFEMESSFREFMQLLFVTTGGEAPEQLNLIKQSHSWYVSKKDMDASFAEKDLFRLQEWGDGRSCEFKENGQVVSQAVVLRKSIEAMILQSPHGSPF